MEDVKSSWRQVSMVWPYLCHKQQISSSTPGILQERNGPWIGKNDKIINGHVEKIDLIHSYMYLEARRLMSINAFFPLMKENYIKHLWHRMNILKITRPRKLAVKRPTEMMEMILA